MGNPMIAALRCLLVMFLACLVAGPALAKPDKSIETFSGRVSGGPAGISATGSFNAYVKRYASEAEAQELIKLLSEGGHQALMDVLCKMDSGTLTIEGNVGQTVAVARQLQDERGGRIIRLVLCRNIGYREMTNASSTTGYPLSYVELHVSPDGRGDGTYAVAAAVQFNGGSLAMKSYSAAPARVLGIRARVPK